MSALGQKPTCGLFMEMLGGQKGEFTVLQEVTPPLREGGEEQRQLPSDGDVEAGTLFGFSWVTGHVLQEQIPHELVLLTSVSPLCCE